MFTGFLAYFNADNTGQKGQSVEELQARETSAQVIEECDLDCVIDDTKFLRTSSLQVGFCLKFAVFETKLYKNI